MSRSPEITRKTSRRLKISLCSDFEDSQENDLHLKHILKPSILHPKTKSESQAHLRGKHLDEMKKNRIELDRQIDLKQKLAQNCLLPGQDLEAKIGTEIPAQVKINPKDRSPHNQATCQRDPKGPSRVAQVIDWVKRQRAINLKSKIPSIPSKALTKPPTKAKRSVTPTVLSKVPHPPSLDGQHNAKNLTRQISNTIQKARETRKLITKSTSPVLN